MLQHGIKLFGSVACEQAQCGLQHPQTGHHAAGRGWLDPLGLPATQRPLNCISNFLKASDLASRFPSRAQTETQAPKASRV